MAVIGSSRRYLLLLLPRIKRINDRRLTLYDSQRPTYRSHSACVFYGLRIVLH